MPLITQGARAGESSLGFPKWPVIRTIMESVTEAA